MFAVKILFAIMCLVFTKPLHLIRFVTEVYFKEAFLLCDLFEV